DVFAIDDPVFHLHATRIVRYERGQGFTGECFRAGYLLSVFRYERTWDYQERHPDADEIVMVLEGRIDLLLDRNDGNGEGRVTVRRGEGALIPTGAWHRVATDAPCELLFATPAPARTEHRVIASLP